MITVLRVTFFCTNGERVTMKMTDSFPSVKSAKIAYREEMKGFDIKTIYLDYEEEVK